MDPAKAARIAGARARLSLVFHAAAALTCAGANPRKRLACP